MTKKKKQIEKDIELDASVDEDEVPVDEDEVEDSNILDEVAQFDELEPAEAEEEYYLDEKAEELLNEIAEEKTDAIGVPALLRDSAPQSNDYPTENHAYTRTKYRDGDIAPPHNPTLIIRK